MAASRMSAVYWPASPSVRRVDDWPIVVGAAPPSPSVTVASSPGRAISSIAIVDPPFEDQELQPGDQQRHAEQPDGVHRPDADVVGPVEAVGLENQRLGR